MTIEDGVTAKVQPQIHGNEAEGVIDMTSLRSRTSLE